MPNNSRFFFVLLAVGAAIGIGNIWVYPYLSFKLTGLFFIPYLLALLVFGIPLLVLEFSAGQYFNKNIIDAFASTRKWFSSLGWFMAFNALILMSMYAVVLSWHIIYIFVSMGLQWKNEAKDYFFNNVLQASGGFNNFTQFSLPVFIALIIVWFIIYNYIKRGFESVKRGFLATIPVLLALMLAFMLYSLSLDNALAGIYLFLKPNLDGILDFNAWISAFSLAAISIGISTGVMHAIAGKSGKGYIFRASFIVVFFEFLISVAVGLIVFGIFGFLSVKQNASIANLPFLDIGSEFTVLAQALPFFYKPSIISIFLFLFLGLFFLLGAVALAYSVSHVLVHKFNTERRNAAIATIGIGFLCSLLFIIGPGYYIMDLANHFIYYNILIAILFEVLAIGWFFDSEKIAYFLNQNSRLKIGFFWRFIVRYALPLIIGLLLFFRIKADYLLRFKDYPFWAVAVFGVGIVVLPAVIAFLMPQKILDRK